MDFAANAVIEAVAPTRQPARAPADRSEPGFEDHLEAATAHKSAEDPNRAPRTEANVEADAATKESTSETHAAAEAPPLLIAQPATAPPAAPILLQMIDAPNAPVAPAPDDQPTEIAAPHIAPTKDLAAKAPPALPAAAAPPPNTENIESVETADAPTPIANKASDAAPTTQPPPPAQQQAPVTQAAPAPVPAQPPIQTTHTQTPQTSPPTAAATTVQAAAAPASRPAPPIAQDSGKTEAARNGKAEVAAKATEQTTAQNSRNGGPNAVANIVETPVQAAATAEQNTALNPSHLQATTASASAAHTQHAVLDQSAARAAPAASQVAREIVRRFDGENTRFELRLDPPELGRVEVRLEVSRDHRVTAVVAADSPQALTELARHARELEQALQSAGLELTDNGLSFDLRQSRDESGDGERSGGSAGADGEEQLTETPASARPIGFERWRGVRVDVMV